MWRKGSKVTFSVTGEAEADGQLSIGCKTFTESEIREVGFGISVTPPPGPTFSRGDVIKIVRRPGVTVLNPDSHGRVYVRNGLNWDRVGGDGNTTSDAWIASALAGDNSTYTVEFLARAGVAV